MHRFLVGWNICWNRPNSRPLSLILYSRVEQLLAIVPKTTEIYLPFMDRSNTIWVRVWGWASWKYRPVSRFCLNTVRSSVVEFRCITAKYLESRVSENLVRSSRVTGSSCMSWQKLAPIVYTLTCLAEGMVNRQLPSAESTTLAPFLQYESLMPCLSMYWP